MALKEVSQQVEQMKRLSNGKLMDKLFKWTPKRIVETAFSSGQV